LTPSKGRPPKDVDRENRIIAKVCEQCYRWGFSKEVFLEKVAIAACNVLERRPTDDDADRPLRDESVRKIYLQWQADQKVENKRKWGVGWNNFARSRYTVEGLRGRAPKAHQLQAVAEFFMRYMDKEPERCIFQDPPECPPDLSWAFFDGEIDGDLPLSKKNQERTRRSPRIRKKK